MVTSWSYDVVVAGHYAYIAKPIEGLWVMDISDPVTPQKITVFSKPEPISKITFNRLFISGNLIYLVANQITIIDISNPTNPKEVLSIPLYQGPEILSYQGLTQAGHYIYYFLNYLPE